jgi:hypothetical protein
MRTFSAGLVLLFLASAAVAADSSDKSQFTLCNPTPSDLLRPLEEVSPFDRTPNPFTVDAGHFLLESSLVNAYTTSRSETLPDGVSRDRSHNEFAWTPSFAVGLSNNVDFEIQPSYAYEWERYEYSPSGRRHDRTTSWSGFTSVTSSATINLWGNDNGATALGLIPSLKIPTTDDGGLLPGVTIPLAVRLPEDFMIKVAFGVSETEGSDLADNKYGEFAHHLAIEKKFNDQITGFLNFEAFVTTERSQPWWGYTGFGVGYKITSNLQASAGLQFGMEAAYDYNPYCGIVWRF